MRAHYRLPTMCSIQLVLFSPVPDPPGPLDGTYDMIPMSDYEQQVLGFNDIRNRIINSTRRVVCYNQTIYDDPRLEAAEYIGLTLAIRHATVSTNIQPMYDKVAILILDDDGKMVSIKLFSILVYQSM